MPSRKVTDPQPVMRNETLISQMKKLRFRVERKGISRRDAAWRGTKWNSR